MANTINGFQGNGATSVATQRTSPPAREPSTTAGNTQSDASEEVQITSTASRLASLGQQLSALPAIDQGRVAQISQSLADGTYTISADRIASGLMQSDRALARIGIQET
ncbi:MAG: flagellar biosynthesis anti-sigma factor FlgM [Steroidobacteraceae bacterium]